MKSLDINDTMRTEGAEGVRERLANAKPYNGNAFKNKTVAGSPGNNEPATGPKLITRSASLIKPEPISWIWRDRFARGKQTAIAGEPGLGKSQFGVFVTATITTGGSWPDGGGQAPKGRVIVLSAEDDPADTIVPRSWSAFCSSRCAFS